MTPEQAEDCEIKLCGLSADDLLAASAECTATRLDYVARMRRRDLTPAESDTLAFVEDLQDLIQSAQEALTCMLDEIPGAVAQRRERH